MNFIKLFYLILVLANITLNGSFKGHESVITAVAFSFNRKYAVTASRDDNKIFLWNLNDFSWISRKMLWDNSDYVVNAAFSPDGKYLFASLNDEKLVYWDLTASSGKCCILKGHTDGISSIAFSSDGNFAITGSYDSTAIIWNLTKYPIQHRILKGHSSIIEAVDLSAQGDYALTGSRDGTAKLWDLTFGEKICKFTCNHKKKVDSVRFTSDNNYALIGAGNKVCNIWDLTDSEIKVISFKHNINFIISNMLYYRGLHSFEFSELFSSKDGLCKLILVAEKRQKYINKKIAAKDYQIKFTDDGRSAFIKSELFENKIIIYDLTQKKLTSKVIEHNKGISAMAFSKDSRYLLAGSWDNAVGLYSFFDDSDSYFAEDNLS